MEISGDAKKKSVGFCSAYKRRSPSIFCRFIVSSWIFSCFIYKMNSIWYDTNDVNDAECGENPSTHVGNKSNCLDKYCSCSANSLLGRTTRRQFIGFMIVVAVIEFGIFVTAVESLKRLELDEGLVHIISIVLLFILVTIIMYLMFKFQEKELRRKTLEAEESRRRIAARNQRYSLPPMVLDDEEERMQQELEEILRRQREERLQQGKKTCSREDSSSSLLAGGEELDIPVISESENCNKTRQSVSIEVHNPPLNAEESLNSSETAPQEHDSTASSEKQKSSGSGEERPQAKAMQKLPTKLKKPEQSKTKEAPAQKSTKKSPLETVQVKGDSQAGEETRQSPSEESGVRSVVFSSEDKLPATGGTGTSSAADNHDGESSV